jgi:hypothetical protein
MDGRNDAVRGSRLWTSGPIERRQSVQLCIFEVTVAGSMHIECTVNIRVDAHRCVTSSLVLNSRRRYPLANEQFPCDVPLCASFPG